MSQFMSLLKSTRHSACPYRASLEQSLNLYDSYS